MGEHMELCEAVKCIATDHVELREEVEQFTTDISINKVQPSTAATHENSASCLAPAGMAMKPDQPATHDDGAACKLKDLEELERELQEECAAQAAHDANGQCDDVQTLKEDVANLKDASPLFLKPATDLSKRSAGGAKHSFAGPDLWMDHTACYQLPLQQQDQGRSVTRKLPRKAMEWFTDGHARPGAV